MPDTAAEARGPGIGAVIRKRWRGWLRSLHRDIGYLAVGFTFIYAVSGIAINHIKDWDPNFHATEKTLSIAPIPPDLPDAEAVKRVTDATGTGAPDDVFRAGDELRLSYSDGAQVTVVGDQVTVQARKPRFFLRVANWLHYNRGKAAWTIVADIYAVMLLYLAISGLFMLKGKLGLRWRGTILVGLGIAVPVTYVMLSGGPNAANAKVAETAPATAPAGPAAKPTAPDDEFARPQPRVQPPPESSSASDSGDDFPQMKPRTPAGSASTDSATGTGSASSGSAAMSPAADSGEFPPMTPRVPAGRANAATD